MKRKRKIAVILIGSLLLTGCAAQLEEIIYASKETTESIFAMDTYMTVTAYGAHGKEAVAEAVKEIQRLDDLLSTGSEESEVTALNQNGGGILSEDTAYLWEKSVEAFEETKGAFDVTIYPVMKAWGFADSNFQVPEKEMLQKLIQKVDSSAAVYDEEIKNLQLPQSVEIDFGGIAKGYTSERVAQVMKDCGVKSGMLNLGGNVELIGEKPDGSKFKVAIQSPAHDGNYLGVLQISDMAVITSGSYERYFEEGGVTYHHIIDPATGYPAKNGLLSVTIVSQDATLADAYSTALFVMGTQEAISFWRTHTEEFDAVLLTEEGELLVTEGLQGVFSSERVYHIMEKQEGIK